MQMAFYFDQTRCIGCFACVTSCKQWHQLPPGSPSWRQIVTIERGKFPNVNVNFLSSVCYNCEHPTCVDVCPAQAIIKREEDGVVLVDSERCRNSAPCGIISPNGTRMRAVQELKSPCRIGCPADVSIPGYIALIASRRFSEALDLIRENIPLPGVLGRICPAPCETVCSRQNLDQPIAIAALKRFLVDHAAERAPFPIHRKKEEKVAIIGSGPSGLAAAYDLVKKGYGVTIFEKLPVAGGMLAVGIPDYRLPKMVLERDINYIKALGVEIKNNICIGRDVTLGDLVDQGYNAVFIAIGAHFGIRPSIHGADLEGTQVGPSFLKAVNLGMDVKVGQKILVLGGGNVALDCGRTAMRLGASEVHVVCPESKENMPAYPSEIQEGVEEGIIIHPQRTIKKILGTEGKVTGVELISLRSMHFTGKGLLQVDPIHGSEHIFEVDTVIFAIGQVPDIKFLSGIEGITETRQGTIAVNPHTLEAGRPGVFAGGDAVSGPTSSIEAIASGKKAASSIDSYLQCGLIKQKTSQPFEILDIKINIPADVEKASRQKIPALEVTTRIKSFVEVALGLTEEMAIAEARRCLNCAGHLCLDVCPYSAPQFGTGLDAKMEMCNFCQDRLAEDKKPICVEACITKALDAGPLEQLQAKYGKCPEAEGFIYFKNIKPSVLFKQKNRKGFG